MVLQTLIALLFGVQPLMQGAAIPLPEREVSVQGASYRPESREVSNWRAEAADALEPRPVAVLAAFLKAERPFVTRCVKLNNYWCIKSARWNGEIATDSEGHVGFASAGHGAEAAATLLRRYYLDFDRKSALDIVRRWAPPECRLPTGIGDMAVLAVKGIGGTLRARYLASRRGGNVVRYTAAPRRGGKPGRVSVSFVPKTPLYRAPEIAAGMGEKAKPQRPPARPVASRQPEPTATGSLGPEKPKPQAATACAPDEQRIRNYAARMAEGLALKPTDDLKLFAQDGTPLPNLAAVMLAMSAFELGMLRASPDLVAEAIARVTMKAEWETRR